MGRSKTPVSTRRPKPTFRVEADGKKLRYGNKLVKWFRQPAKNQVTVLQSFEDRGWPATIVDPFPPTDGIDPKERVHDVINNLKRNQIHRLIDFFGDGTGTGIGWRRREEKTKRKR